jgi:hypothetical protein
MDFNFGILDMLITLLAAFLLGAMAGYQLLPAKIDPEKEKLIDRLFNENMAYRLAHPLNTGKGGQSETSIEK